MLYSRIAPESATNFAHSRKKFTSPELALLDDLAAELARLPDIPDRTGTNSAYSAAGVENILAEIDQLAAAEDDLDTLWRELDELCGASETHDDFSRENSAEAFTAQGLSNDLEAIALVSSKNPLPRSRQLVPSPLPSSSPPSPRKSLLQVVLETKQRSADEQLRKSAKAAAPLVIPTPWKKLSGLDRVLLCFRNVARQDGIAFSLNFSAKKESSLMRTGDPVGLLSESINLAFKRTFGEIPNYAFVFEFTKEQRLHVHGCVVLPATTDEAIERLRAALKRAGGKATTGTYSGPGRGRQLDTRDMFSSRGWLGYCLKDWTRTKRLLGTDKVLFMSQKLRRDTEARHSAEIAKLTHQRVFSAYPDKGRHSTL